MSDKILSAEQFKIIVDYACDHTTEGFDLRPLMASHAAQAERIEELKAAVIRRSGSSSWQEWTGIWDPTEETAVEATKRLFQRAEKAELPRWTCFHCGFETVDLKEASAHFGERDDDEEFKPLCKWWERMDEGERAEAFQSIIQDLNAERDETALLLTKIDGLEFRVDGQLAEIHSFKPFRSCSSINEVFHVYDSMEGRALVAEERAVAAEGMCIRNESVIREQYEEGKRLTALLRQIREVLPIDLSLKLADFLDDLGEATPNGGIILHLEADALRSYAALLESNTSQSAPTWQQQAEREATDFFEKDGHRWVRMTSEEEAAKRLAESLV